MAKKDKKSQDSQVDSNAATDTTTASAKNLDEKAPEFNEFEGNIKHEQYDDTAPQISNMGENIEIPEVVPVRSKIDINPPKENTFSQNTEQSNQSSQTSTSPVSNAPSNIKEAKKEGENKKITKGNLRLADAFIYIYGLSKQLTYSWANLETYKLENRAWKGKFDMVALEVRFPIEGRDEPMSVKAWLDNYNYELRKCLYINPVTRKVELTDPKFVSMRDNLAQMLANSGHEMSARDEFFFDMFMDISDTASTVFALNRDTRKILSMASAYLHDNNLNGTFFLQQQGQSQQKTKQTHQQYIEPQQQAPQPPPLPDQNNYEQTNTAVKIDRIIKPPKYTRKKERRMFSPDQLEIHTND